MYTKRMYGVEYKTGDSSTYDIFEDLASMIEFCVEIGTKRINIFAADFNEDRIFKEENGVWNYEDCADTFTNLNIIA